MCTFVVFFQISIITLDVMPNEMHAGNGRLKKAEIKGLFEPYFLENIPSDICVPRRFRSTCASTLSDQSLRCPFEAILHS